jgi:hypothetical protein
LIAITNLSSFYFGVYDAPAELQRRMELQLQPERLQMLALGLLLVFVNYLEIGVNHVIAFFTFFFRFGRLRARTGGAAARLIGRGLLVKFGADRLEPGLQVLRGSLNGVRIFTL